MKKIKRLNLSNPINESESYSLGVTRNRIKTILSNLVDDVQNSENDEVLLENYTQELVKCFDRCSNDKWKSLERDLSQMFDSDARIGLAILDTIRKH